nr:FCD domain-containing protein [Methylobacterium platani]
MPRVTAAGEARLAAHVAAEDAAMAAGDRFTSIRLSAEFHTILADLTGNPLIQRQMQELVARTMMLVAFFEPDSSVACQYAEHRAVFRALGGRSRAGAVRAMTTHLSLVETRLRPRICEAVPPPLDDVLRDALAAWRGGLTRIRPRGAGAAPALTPDRRRRPACLPTPGRSARRSRRPRPR